MLTLGQRVQHPGLLQIPPELLALRVCGLERRDTAGSVSEWSKPGSPEEEEGGKGAGGESGNPPSPRELNPPPPQNLCTRVPIPTQVLTSTWLPPASRHPSLCNGP